MVRFRLLVVVGLLVFGSTSVEMKAQSPEDVAMAMKFVGMWRQVSRPERLTDGTTRQNPQTAAYIVYTDTAPVHMCFVAMDPNRPKWKSPSTPTAEEQISAVEGLSAYCSTVEIHAKEGFVLHHVEIARIPNAVGATWKRW